MTLQKNSVRSVFIRKRVVLTLLAAVAVLVVVYAPVAINEFKADRLAMQISSLETYGMSGKSQLLTSDGYTFLGGNGELIGYGATSVFTVWVTDETRSQLATDIQKMVVHWGDCSDCGKVETFNHGMFLVVNVTVGPYDAGFDWRYW